MEPIIKVENLSKKYVLRHQAKEQYVALRDVITNTAKSLVTSKTGGQATREEFWALKDISFEINKGERIGIIGRNGAGKSTLLKIFSRITEPTEGRITIDGRVSSLLEVGTGFHPELTGRENVFLNGSILGMGKREIEAKFDEIVAFAEVEKFLDTPVKRYSSGMYVRLAFAVAAHLEPDILIVDEVLAVGDAAFQKKCLGKMEDVSKSSGRTIIFVSHNMSAIRSTCNKAIFLEKGKIECHDDIDTVISHYYNIAKATPTNGVQISSTPLASSGEWEVNSDIEVEIKWDKYKYEPGWQCDIACYTIDGVKIFALESHKFHEFRSDDKECNGVKFIVRNVGFPNTELRLDVGIKKSINESYCNLIENCLRIFPSGNNLPAYLRHDVITIPPAQCKAITL